MREIKTNSLCRKVNPCSGHSARLRPKISPLVKSLTQKHNRQTIWSFCRAWVFPFSAAAAASITQKWCTYLLSSYKFSNIFAFESLILRFGFIFYFYLYCELQIRFILLQNRQGKTRLAKYYIPLEESEKHKVEYEVNISNQVHLFFFSFFVLFFFFFHFIIFYISENNFVYE